MSLKRILALLPTDVMDGISKVKSYSDPNPSTLKLLAETALDIKIKTGKNPIDETFHEMAKNSGLKDALDKLRETRFKELSSLTAKIKKQIINTGLKKIKIKFDPKFEDSFIELNAKTYSSNDLKLIKKEIEDLINNKNLDEIFRTYNGN